MGDAKLDALNAPALTYIARLDQAHSDLGSALLAAVEELGAVEVVGNLAACQAPKLFTAGVLFATAIGMGAIHLRLPPTLAERALRCGGEASPIGEGWAAFPLFRPDWPKPDLVFWARKAYAHARDLAAGR